MIDVNLGPALSLTQAVVPHMPQSSGVICTWPRAQDLSRRRHIGL